MMDVPADVRRVELLAAREAKYRLEPPQEGQLGRHTLTHPHTPLRGRNAWRTSRWFRTRTTRLPAAMSGYGGRPTAYPASASASVMPWTTTAADQAQACIRSSP